MRVCILSMQRVPNFGSLLQGYSLKKMIEGLGHEVSFLEIQAHPEEDRLLDGYRKNFSSEYGGGGRKGGWLRKIDRNLFRRLMLRRKNREQSKLMRQFQRQIIRPEDAPPGRRYDCCVIGSDEVFNALNETEWGFTSQLFGNVPQAERVITYAASCGFTSYEALPLPAAAVIRSSFANIARFSVRDANTLHFVEELSGVVPEVHDDPVVAGDFSREAEQAPGVKGLPGRYCIVYAYRDRINQPGEIAAIKRLCRRERMEPVSVGASQVWIRRHPALTPFQLPRVFSGAAFVVTDTFHGTVFAAKYAKKFAVLIRPSNENKLSDLLLRLEIENHRADSPERLEEIYQIDHDLHRMREMEAAAREKAAEYLREAISGAREI